MECAQIEVSGGTGSASPATYSIPGIYKVSHMTRAEVTPRLTTHLISKATDPGILINIYSMTPASTYTIPGNLGVSECITPATANPII